MTRRLQNVGRTAASVAVVAMLAMVPAVSQDKPETLTILSHRVHHTVATGEQGGDITEAWQKENGIDVQWVTMETGPLHERLFRELALPETSIDIGFLLNTRAVESVTSLLAPVDSYMENDPIEDFNDVFKGLVDGMTFDGKLYGIPFRHARPASITTSAFSANAGWSVRKPWSR